jgi:hypothetical protein
VVDAGRINFKRGAEKLPFALVNVSGNVVQDATGQWTLDISADPMRTSVMLQDAGTLRLRGTVGNRSERLRPAILTLEWEQASLADAVRLASGRDYGVRGTLSGQFTAAVKPEPPAAPAGVKLPDDNAAQWKIAGTLHVAGVHGWNVAGRVADPQLNVTATGVWGNGDSQLNFTQAVIDAPHSHVEAAGFVNWSSGFRPGIEIVSSNVAFDDVLGWQRAFRPGIAAAVAIDGAASVTATVADWPLQIQQASITSAGAVIRTGAAIAPVTVGPLSSTLQHGSLILSPVTVSLPGAPVEERTAGRAETSATRVSPGTSPAGTIRVEGSLGPLVPGIRLGNLNYRVALTGNTQRTQDLLAFASAFGRPGSAEWTATGAASVRVVRAGFLGHPASTLGTIEMRGLTLTSVLMNQPVEISSATVDLGPGERRVKIASAGALGAHWKGTLQSRDRAGSDGGADWVFDLTADDLNAAELDRWLGPRARSFLARILPFTAASNPPSRNGAIERIDARGRLRVGTMAVASLHVEKLDAKAELRGRSLLLHGARGEFYGGRLTGDLDVHLEPEPSYAFHGQVERANLAAAVAASPSLAGRFAGLASGDLHFTAKGIGRDDLLNSLSGEGTLHVRDAAMNAVSAPAGVVAGDAGPSASPVSWPASWPVSGASASASNVAAGLSPTAGQPRLTTVRFHVADSRISLDRVLLAGVNDYFEMQGSVDFARHLDLHVSSGATPDALTPVVEVDAARDSWILSGTLDAPQWTRQSTLARTDAAAARARQRQ